jgi:protein KTI12
MRYETPDGRNRWDAPLFTIQPEDELSFESIAAALYERKAPTPNQSTQSVHSMIICLLEFFKLLFS